MCGIAGFLTPGGLIDDAAAHRLVSTMRDSLVHRGPDDFGTWLDPAGGVAFGFRRLSIVDLSAAGHQPMLSADGRYAIMLNGEVYNAAEIRAEIEASCGPHAWRGHCDTEVLVEAIATWGVEAAVQRVNGMFAIAVWDRRDRVLWLVRDRIGKKPLYLGWAGGSFVFGSELKALWPHPGFDYQVSAEALRGFLQLGYVLGPRSIFAGISKLPPGHILRLDERAAAARQTPPSTAYWRLIDAAHAGLDAQASGRPADEEELEALLDDAVARRMIADVPVGAFLSGGIDSSLITAIMTRHATSPMHTFAIGFAPAEWDEAGHARAVAAHLGTVHEESYVTPEAALSVLTDVGRICDEPLADHSIVPTTLLSRLARRSVSVALSGDGGDELFLGYRRYAAAEAWLARRAALPASMRPLAGCMAAGLAQALPGRFVGERVERRLFLLSHLLMDKSPERFGELILSQTFDPGPLLARPDSSGLTIGHSARSLDRSGPVDRMAFMDTQSFLVDDILAKVDRASMSASLEVRCPLLDYRVVELSWRFPAAAKHRQGTGKRPLRALLHRRVPPALVDRPKMGFGAPVHLWLRHELRDWAEALMTREALARHGLLNVDACRALWEDFAHHGHGWTRVLWNLLIFQAWDAVMASAGRQHARREALLVG